MQIVRHIEYYAFIFPQRNVSTQMSIIAQIIVRIHKSYQSRKVIGIIYILPFLSHGSFFLKKWPESSSSLIFVTSTLPIFPFSYILTVLYSNDKERTNYKFFDITVFCILILVQTNDIFSNMIPLLLLCQPLPAFVLPPFVPEWWGPIT